MHQAPDLVPSVTVHVGMAKDSVRSGDNGPLGSPYIMSLLWHLVHLGFHLVICP